MLKQNYEKIKAISDSLSATATLGEFDFWTFSVSLDSLKLTDLEVLTDDNLTQAATNFNHRRVLSLANHEYTHFIDSTSTIWGINHLLMINNAYSTNGIPGEEINFYKAKEFDIHMTKIKYPKYYRIIGDVENPKDWQLKTTLGKLFSADGRISDETIIFVRFKTLFGEEIARTPISPIAILEASAMANEMLLDMELLKKLSGEEYTSHNASFADKIMKTIYDKELTEYTACVHLVSISQKCTDVLQSFILVSLITKILLNCTETLYDKILKDNKFKDLLNVNENDGVYTAIKQGLLHRNMGVLYYLLVLGLPADSYNNISVATEGVSISLSKLGLDIDIIKQLAKEDFAEKYEKILKTNNNSLRQLTIAARENFDLIDIQKLSLPFNELHLPKVILGDFDENDNIAESFIYQKDNNKFEKYNIDESVTELLKGREWVKRFSESCI